MVDFLVEHVAKGQGCKGGREVVYRLIEFASCGVNTTEFDGKERGREVVDWLIEA